MTSWAVATWVLVILLVVTGKSPSFAKLAEHGPGFAELGAQMLQLHSETVSGISQQATQNSSQAKRRLTDCWSYGNFTWISLLDYAEPPAVGCACTTNGFSGGTKVVGVDNQPIAGCIDETQDPLANGWSAEFGPWCYVADPANCTTETDSETFIGAGWSYCDPPVSMSHAKTDPSSGRAPARCR